MGSPRRLDLAPAAPRADERPRPPAMSQRSEPDPAAPDSPGEPPRPEGPGSPPRRPRRDGPQDVAAEACGGPSDHDLVRGAQAGDEAAFELLVRRHQARAWRVARNLVPNDEDARDLAQEAFLRVFRSLDRFDFQHDFTTWLYRIVTNLGIDHLRKRRPQVSTAVRGEGDEEVELDLPDTDAPAPSSQLESAETAERVRACIDSLAPHFQVVLTLRELEGLPCTEIAAIVGASHVTVRWRLHRGRKLFQEEWERRERLAERGDASGASAEPRPRP